MNLVMVSSSGIDTDIICQFLESNGFDRALDIDTLQHNELNQYLFVNITTVDQYFLLHHNSNQLVFFFYLPPQIVLASLLGTTHDSEIIENLSCWLSDINFVLNLYKQNRKKYKLINYNELCMRPIKFAELLNINSINDSGLFAHNNRNSVNVTIANALVEKIQELKNISNELEACSVAL